jgi:superfamily II DNA or RNA helicase
MGHLIGYIYVRDSENYKNYFLYKVGMTQNLYARNSNYRTGEVKLGSYVRVYQIFYHSFLKEPRELLFGIEKMIQIKYKHLHSTQYSGGTEFFDISIAQELDNYFTDSPIECKILTQEEITTIMLEESLTDNVHDSLWNRKYKNIPYTTEVDFYINYYKGTKFPYQLRGYQINAYKQLCDFLKNKDKVQLNVMCRAGKTVLFQKYIFDHLQEYCAVLYVTNKLALIDQVNQRMERIFNNVVEISSSNSEYTKKELKFDKTEIINVCRDSFSKIASIQFPGNVLIVYDEAHRLCTDNMLDDHPFNIKINTLGYVKQIFVTATPIYGSIIGNSAYMNNIKLFGDSIIKYNDINGAIEDKFICPVNILISSYESSIHEDTKDSDTPELLQPELLIRLTHVLNMLKSVYSNENYKSKPRKILMYMNSTKNIDLVEQQLKSQHIIEFQQIYSMRSMKNGQSVSTKENRRNLDEFTKTRESPVVLLNCQMVSEGIDVNDIDTVILLEPRHSKVEIVQIAFRPMNYIEDKQAYIIIPELFDNISSSKYKTSVVFLRELFMYNSALVANYIETTRSSSRSSKKSSKHSLKDVNGTIEIDENIREEVLKLSDITITDGSTTIQSLIVTTLQNYAEQTIENIVNLIDTHPMAVGIFRGETLVDKITECKLECDDLIRKKKIITLLIDNIEYYRAIISYKTSDLETYYKKLRRLQIYTVDDLSYYFEVNKSYPDNLNDPKNKYPDFEWDDVYINRNTDYTLEECKKRINDLISIHQIGCKNKLRQLHNLDNRIPLNPVKFYNLHSLAGLHSLFHSIQTKTRR